MPSRRSRSVLPVDSIEPVQDPLTDTRLTVVNDEAAIDALIDRIFDPSRYQPLIVVSCAGDTDRPRVSLTDLLTAVEDSANIVLIARHRLSWALSDRLPETMRCYGGAIRMWWPYADRSDENRHPSFVTMTEDAAPGTIRSIRRALVRLGFLTEPEPSTKPGPGYQSVVSPVLVQQIRPDSPRASEVIAALREELRLAQERASAATLDASALRRQVRTLTEQLESANAQRVGQRVFTDPVQQFEHEVWLSWLNNHTPDDREQFPLRPYTLGADFLDSVESLEGVDREKIVSTCVDVLTSRVWTHPGRQAHQQRLGTGGNAPAQSREDGSIAWRCSIQNNTPSARRLMWWECVGGSVELARVAIHDDMTIR